MKKNSLKEWLHFDKRNRNAAIILLAILATVMILPYIIPSKQPEIHIDKALQAELDSLRQQNALQSNQPFYAAYNDTVRKDTVHHELFYFDPNTLSEEGFVKLGLPPKTAHTIINYRNKGGHFKTAEDIRKIYSLSKADADRIIPYIRITPSSKETTTVTKEDITGTEKPAYQPKQLKQTEINTATVEDWKAFPGIGDVLANRIVKFRNSMGGFTSVDQVAKTYGLSDSVFQVIKPYLYKKD